MCDLVKSVDKGDDTLTWIDKCKHRKEEAEKDAKAAELFKELANIAEVKLPFPKFKIEELITNAQNTINDEFAILIKLMQQKEWKQERGQVFPRWL